ncbi:hypothetical protein [Terasakiella sp.]|uniref:hypothetical protein n=1 Tax=Terasakiella sp. TaxID=2034861 RepID=UPI003AA84257
MATGLMKNSGAWVKPPFVYGLVIGAAAAYVLTNKNVQNTIFRTAAGAVNALKGGLEEAKERFNDAEAEIQAEAEDETTAASAEE